MGAKATAIPNVTTICANKIEEYPIISKDKKLFDAR